MLDKFKKEDFLKFQQFNDWLGRFDKKNNHQKKSYAWLWVLFGLVVVAGAAFAVYKFLCKNDYDEFDEDEFDEFDDFEDYDDEFDDLSYDEDVDEDALEDDVEEALEGEESVDNSVEE